MLIEADDIEQYPSEFIPAVDRLRQDLLLAAESLTVSQARYLVDCYYQMQEFRKRAANQGRAAKEGAPVVEPSLLVTWLLSQFKTLEGDLKKALDRYSDQSVVGRWSKSLYGIGPVISAGLLAHIDITKAPTVGHIWRFAGLDPTMKWAKGQKRPWNAQLKTLCWKASESFVKFKNRGCFYGPLYDQRKAFEIERNDRMENKDAATRILLEKKFSKSTEAYGHYSQGKLPPAQLHARAERWTVKLFLAHWHAVAYRAHYGKDAPKPYVISILGHADEIRCPNWPF